MVQSESSVYLSSSSEESEKSVPKRKRVRGSELWETRERKFENFRKSNIVLPVPNECTVVDERGNRVTIDGPIRLNHRNGYYLEIENVKNFNKPLDFENDVVYAVHISFFHGTTKRFFGNTWTSEGQSGEQKLQFKIQLFYVSTIMDSNCIAVMELVAMDRIDGIVLNTVGCGWAILPVFGNGKLVDAAKESHLPFDTIPLYKGSPRLLLSMEQSEWQEQEKVKNCKLRYRIKLYEAMKSVGHLLRDNEMVASGDIVPGLMDAKIETKSGIKMLVQREAPLLKVIPLAKSFTLIAMPRNIFVHLREELEANLIARLANSQKQWGGKDLKGEITARVLKVGAHNGRCFTGRQQILPLKIEGKSSDYLTVQDSAMIKQYALHSLYAIVFVLQYTVHFRSSVGKESKTKNDQQSENVLVVAIGARAMLPSDERKLYTKDTSAESATLGLNSVQIELLAGASARPYTDAILYTTPTRVGSHGNESEVVARINVELDAREYNNNTISNESNMQNVENSDTNSGTDSDQSEKANFKSENQMDTLLEKAIRQKLNVSDNEEKKQADFPEISSPNLRPAEPVELSRATRTMLSRHGFSDILEDSCIMNKQALDSPVRSTLPKMKKSNRIFSLEIERMDKKKAHEVSFQFAGYRHVTSEKCSSKPNCVYFTFQFYNCKPSRSERMALFRSGGSQGTKLTQNDSNLSPPYVLMRQDQSKEKLGPSRLLQFNVDTTTTNINEEMMFLKYLECRNMRIDVWDASTLMQIGTATIPLRQLLRQGNDYIKYAAEYDIISPQTASAHPELTGKLQLIMCNHGYMGIHTIDELESKNRQENFISQQDNDNQISHWRDSTRNVAEAMDSSHRRPRYRIEAKPIFDTNKDLMDLLKKEGFYKQLQSIGGTCGSDSDSEHVVNSSSDSSIHTITNSEIHQLCENFADDEKLISQYGNRILCYEKRFLNLLAVSIESVNSILQNKVANAIEGGINLDSLFENYDPDKSGFVSNEDFDAVIQKLGIKNIPVSDILEMVYATEDNISEGIPYKNFVNHFRSSTATKLSEPATSQKLEVFLRKAIQQGISLRKLFSPTDSKLTISVVQTGLEKLDYFDSVMDTVKSSAKPLPPQFSLNDFLTFMNLKDTIEKENSNWEQALEDDVRMALSNAADKGLSTKDIFSRDDNSSSTTLSAENVVLALQDIGMTTMIHENAQLLIKIVNGKDHISDEVSVASLCEKFPTTAMMTNKLIERVLVQLKALSPDNVAKSFQQFDTTGNGEVSTSDFLKAFVSLGFQTLSRVEIHLFSKQYQTADTGKCNYSTLMENIKTFEATECNTPDPSIQEPEVSIAIKEYPSLDTYTEYLNNAFSKASADGKYISKTFQGLQKHDSGYLSLKLFKKGLSQLDIDVAQDEFLHGATKATGCLSSDNKIDYLKFLKTILLRKFQASKEPTSLKKDYECTFQFSADPLQRSLEVKVRRAALRYTNSQSGSTGTPESLLLRFDTKRKGFLYEVDLVQYLMQLGLTLREIPSNPPLSGLSDSVRARQMDRVRRLRQSSLGKKLSKKTRKAVVSAANGVGNNSTSHAVDYEQKKKMLSIIQLYRDGHKNALIQSMLRRQVTTRYVIYPKFGQLEFFEFPIVNPYTHAERFRIEFEKSELNIVYDAHEWETYRKTLVPAVRLHMDPMPPIESELIDESNELMIDRKDTVLVPFKFLSMELESKTSYVLNVFCKSVAHGQTISVLQLEVKPQSFSIHRTERFYEPSRTIMKRTIQLPLVADYSQEVESQVNRNSRTKYIYCTDPNVVVETQRGSSNIQDVLLKHRVGNYPSSSDFYLLVYNDRYHSILHERWHICIQSMLRLDMHTCMGQSAKNELVLKGDTQPRRVRCYSSSPRDVSFNPSGVFQLIPQAYNRVEVCFRSRLVGPRCLQLHLVDVDSNELVSAWSLETITGPPQVTKSFQVDLQSGESAYKKISYTNRWQDDRIYTLQSSNESIMKPRYARVQMAPRGQEFLRLWFSGHDHGTKEVYLFINDENCDQNEECLLIQLHWTS